MAAGALQIYTRNLNILDLTDFVGQTIKMALVDSSYTPNTASNGHYLWADVSANEIAGVFGYTTGGATLTDSVTAIANGYNYDSDNIVWTASGGSIPAWRYAVIYVSGTVSGLLNPLIGYFLGDTAPADIPATTAGNNLTIQVNVSGWFTSTANI